MSGLANNGVVREAWKMWKHSFGLVAAIFLAVAGCATLDNGWSLKPPESADSPWDRVIPTMAFSNTPLPQVLIALEELANATGSPEIRLSIADGDDSSLRDGDFPRITFRAQEIRLRDALGILGDITHHSPVYGEREVVFAPRGHADGSTTIVLEGRARSRSTGKPIRRISLVCTRYAMMFDNEPLTTIYDVETDADGGFSLAIPVTGYSDVVSLGRQRSVSYGHPTPQRMSILAVADRHYPSRYGIDLTETNLQYRLEVEMDQ